MWKFNPFSAKLDYYDPYTLPTASDTVKGGVKIGLRLTMTDDVLSADVQAGGGDVLAPAIHAASYIPQWNTTANSKTLVEGLAVPAGGLAGITALDLKANLASPTFTGTVVIPTPFTIGAVSMTATGTELNYVVGVTSAIQTQLNAKAATLAGTINEIAYFNSASTIASLAVATYPSLAELARVKGVTSAIQTQLDAKGVGDMTLAGVQSVTGLKTFDTTKLAVKGSSTGSTAIASANASATGYTATLQAATGTLAFTSDITGTNSGTNTGDQNLSGLATLALDNLASVAINTSLTSDTDITDDLGTGDIRWKDIHAASLNAGLTATDTLKLRGRDVDGAVYVDILTITSANTVTADLNAITTIGGNAILYSGGDAGTPSALVGTNISGTITSITLVTPVLGTPASGTLTNCTFPTLNQNTTGSAASLSATLAIASGGTGATTLAGASIPTYTSTNTFTNKRITPRVLSAASYTTDTGTSLNCDDLDQFIVTAQAGALLFNNPTGTPVDGQKLIIAVTGTAARALTYGAAFEASTVALPATTVTTARLNIGFIWRADTSKWVCVASA